ncbi:unnamed protein product [marine sediment metagenome]|uniref:Uncharacterized protein n=1 Tax=marine sediment metagenome TaxID=412755 RepID=X1B4C1_9ZZZZ
MNPKQVLGALARTLGIVLGLEVVISLLIATLAYRYHWTTTEQISTAYMWAGFLAIGFGFFSLAGFWEGTRSFEHQYSISVINKSSWERTQGNVLDFLQSFRILLWTVAIGGLTLAIAWLITTLDLSVLNSIL